MKFAIEKKPTIVLVPEETKAGEFNVLRIAVPRATVVGESVKLWIKDAHDGKVVQVQIEVADFEFFRNLFASIEVARETGRERRP